MKPFDSLRRALALSLICAPALAQIAPFTASTDPARAQVVLPEPANPSLRSLILIGDSTVRNGKDDGQGKGAEGQWGWGNPIARHFDQSKINVVNRAVGGLSSRTYITSGHWDKTYALIKKGDVVLMQFGHNDSSAINDDSRARGTIRSIGEETETIDNQLTGKREVVHSYGWYLRKFINEIKAKGAIPVVVSSIPRKMWGPDGKVLRGKGDFAGWAEQVARQEHVGFIDLNELAARKYDEMGVDAVMQLFPVATPDERVHTNLAGAELNAQIVADGLKALGIQPPLPFLANPLPREDDRPLADASKVQEEHVANPALPTLFIVGDSTVRSGGQNGAIGWGERIGPYFDSRKINVVNFAIGGRSSRTFYTEGRWDKVAAQLKAGDFVLIQFGHNDGGRIGDPAMKNRASGPGIGNEVVADTRPDGSTEQVHTFGWYMTQYVNGARAKGATPILLSPVPHRDKWQGERDFASFAEWDQAVAKAGGARFIDLTALVTDAYRRIGAENVDTFFSDARTHTNEAGARFNAEQVVAGLKSLAGNPLGPFFAVQ
ncbi:MAG: rhamnogalacturonan acetylesterase [Gammaproteobacteria bacterium]